MDIAEAHIIRTSERTVSWTRRDCGTRNNQERAGILPAAFRPVASQEQHTPGKEAGPHRAIGVGDDVT